jgi:hypothetical protein
MVVRHRVTDRTISNKHHNTGLNTEIRAAGANSHTASLRDTALPLHLTTLVAHRANTSKANKEAMEVLRSTEVSSTASSHHMARLADTNQSSPSTDNSNKKHHGEAAHPHQAIIKILTATHKILETRTIHKRANVVS